MKNRYFRSILLIAAALICLFFLLAGALTLYALQTNRIRPPALISGSVPTIQIASPADGIVISSGEGLVIASVAFSETGLSRVEFRVDDVIVQEKNLSTVSGQAEQIAFPWFASQTGWRKISIVAYDTNGRASEPASIRVGVQSVNPSATPVGSGAGEEGASSGAGDAAQAAPPAAGAPQPQNGLADAGAPLPELPPQPQDAPPVIQSFDVTVLNLIADGAGVRILSRASDDLGIAQMVFSWRKTSGEAGNSFRQLCGAAAECSIDQVAFFTSGEYVLTIQAFDTSGQASEMEAEWVQVFGDAGQPPAVADQDFDFHWEQPGIMDDIARRLGNVDFGVGFGADDFLDGVFGGNDGAGQAGAGMSAEGDCASINVEPQAAGNLVTMTVLCDLQAGAQGGFLYPHVGKKPLNAGLDGGVDLRILEWYDNQRQRIASGDIFTWLDTDVTCGMAYGYTARVDIATESGNGLGVTENLAWVKTETSTPACPPGALGAVNLRSEPRPEGREILWTVAPNGSWPANLPADGVTFTLTRADPITGASLVLYSENTPANQLPAGGETSVLDQGFQCGSATWYNLSAIAANANLGLVSPGWLINTQILVPATPCQDRRLGSIQLRVSPHWFNDSVFQARIQTELPPGMEWPQGNPLNLAIIRARQDKSCAGQPCWENVAFIPITEEIRTNGLVYDEPDPDVQTGQITYAYRLALLSGHDEIESGPGVSLTTPSAPPPSPNILRLTATNNCPAGTARCVIVEWQAYQQPAPNGYFAQADRIAIERVVGAIDHQIFPVGLGDTRFVDLNPYSVEHVMANGSVEEICRWTSTYRMKSFDAEGHTYGSSVLLIDLPECDAPVNIVVEAR